MIEKKTRKRLKKEGIVPEFHYYSLEWAEKMPIISMIPFGDKARLKALCEKEQAYNVFDLNYFVEELIHLKDRLGKDIENHYRISLKTFIGRVPMIRS